MSDLKQQFALRYANVRASSVGGPPFIGPGQPGLPWESFMGISTGTVSDIGSSPLSRIALYRRAIWVYGCTEARVVPLKGVPVKLYQHTPDNHHNEVLNHPISRLLTDINPKWDTGSTIRENTERSLCIHGRYHWLKVRNQEGIVKELYGLPVQFTQIIPNRGDLVEPIDVFRYQPGGKGRFDYRPNDVVYFRYGTPEQDPDGFAPLMVAIETTSSDISIQVAQNAMSTNAARPSAVLTVKPKWSEGDYKRFSEELNRKYAGATNAGKLMLLDNAENVTFNKIQLTPSEMEWIKEHQSHAQDICVAFRTPPMIVNDFSDASRLANAGAGHRFYWENTLLPELKLWEDVLNWQLLWTEDWGRGGHEDNDGNWYSWEYWHGYYLEHDTSSIQALREDENARSVRARNSFGLGLKVDEIRQMVGYDALDDTELGGAVLIANNLVPLDAVIGASIPLSQEDSINTGSDLTESTAEINDPSLDRGSKTGSSSLKTDLAEQNNLTRKQDQRPGTGAETRNAMLSELRRWKKVAAKDLERALDFQSAVLPAELQASIRQALSENGTASFMLPEGKMSKKKLTRRKMPMKFKVTKNRMSSSMSK